MGACSPVFRTVSLKTPEPEKKDAPAPVGPTDSAWLIAVCCQTGRHSSPRFSPSSRCRDTTSCVGVGRVDTRIGRVKKHRCHNWGSLFPINFNVLRVFVPQETPVNTTIFDICRNRARHKILCPPHSHRLRTSRPQDALTPTHRAPADAATDLEKRPILVTKGGFSRHLNRLRRSADRVPCKTPPVLGEDCPGS